MRDRSCSRRATKAAERLPDDELEQRLQDAETARDELWEAISANETRTVRLVAIVEELVRIVGRDDEV